MLGTAEVEMKHRMLHPFLLVFGNGQSLEKLLSSLEIGLKGRGKERLSESSWTTQKDIRHLLFPEIHDELGLVYIEITVLANLRESLNSYGIFIYYLRHFSACSTFQATKLRTKSELAKRFLKKQIKNCLCGGYLSLKTKKGTRKVAQGEFSVDNTLRPFF